jgi:hypothetical protein
MYASFRWPPSESQLEPIGAADDGTSQDQEQYKQDDAAAASGTGHASPEAESLLQPIEEPIEQ